MTEETLRLDTEDGERLLCGLFPGPEGCARGFLLVPGFWGDWRREAYRELARLLSSHGTVLACNMRGHPGSTGWFTFGFREHLDAAALYAEACRRGFGEITAVGFSLGGWALVRHLFAHAPDRERTRHLVLVSTPARLPLMPRPWRRGLWTQLRHGGRGWVLPHLTSLMAARRLEESLAGLGDLPVTFVYGRRDWMVGPRHGESLREAARGPARWLLMDEPRGLHAEMLALYYRDELVDATLSAPEREPSAP